MIRTRAQARAQAAAAAAAVEETTEPEQDVEAGLRRDLQATAACSLARLNVIEELRGDIAAKEVELARMAHGAEQAELYQASLRRELTDARADLKETGYELACMEQELHHAQQKLSDALDAAAERERTLDEAERATANMKRLMAGIERKAAQAADLETSLDAAQAEQRALRAQIDFLARTLSDKQAEAAVLLEENQARKRELDQVHAEQIANNIPPPPAPAPASATVSVRVARACIMVLRHGATLRTSRVIDPTLDQLHVAARELAMPLGPEIADRAAQSVMVCGPTAMDENKTYCILNTTDYKFEIHGIFVPAAQA